jgi:hypothetical protein
MSDTSNTQDPYLDGEVPADADISAESDDSSDSAEEVAEVLPGGGRLNEAEDDPDVDPRDIRPGGDAPLP